MIALQTGLTLWYPSKRVGGDCNVFGNLRPELHRLPKRFVQRLAATAVTAASKLLDCKGTEGRGRASPQFTELADGFHAGCRRRGFIFRHLHEQAHPPGHSSDLAILFAIERASLNASASFSTSNSRRNAAAARL